MKQTFLEVFASNGIWAALFFMLLSYQLSENRKREEEYTKTIEKLAGRLNLLDEINVKLDEAGRDVKRLLENNMRALRRNKNEN